MNPVDQLLHMMATLRDPDAGCPWDRQQDFSSIVPYTIEEAYEVADAIERNAMEDLCTELGDLLFQVVYHSQIASERGLFDFNEVVTAITNKIERRHPHVFADEVIGTAQEQSRAWEQHKRREREGNGMLDDISPALPALVRAGKLQQRAALAGFDWTEPMAVLDKLQEEVEELRQALSAAGESTSGDAAIREEMGDLLFSCVNLARHLQVDAESSLRAANRKFTERFHYMENRLREAGCSLEEVSMEQLETLWQEAKLQGPSSGPDNNQAG